MVFLYAAIFLALYMHIWFFVSAYAKRVDLADIAWGFGFALVAWCGYITGERHFVSLVVNILVTMWALRLGVHIFLRNKGKEEDFRYASLRSEWKGHPVLFLYLQVFLLQGAILYIVALPILFINAFALSQLSLVGWYALFLWGLGFVIETISDAELLLYKSKKQKEPLLQTGLWSTSRHPNFFGELLQWWSLGIVALAAPMGYLTLIGPALLTFIIVFVTGVRPLEEKMEKREGFRAYARKTPVLIPAFFYQSVIYSSYWILAVIFGPQNQFLLLIPAWIICFVALLYFLGKYAPREAKKTPLFATLALALGILQQLFVMHLGIAEYAGADFFPPFWLYSLYPLFALIIPICVPFLRNASLRAFFIGFIGGPLATFVGATYGAAFIADFSQYVYLGITWGIYLFLLSYIDSYLTKKYQR